MAVLFLPCFLPLLCDNMLKYEARYMMMGHRMVPYHLWAVYVRLAWHLKQVNTAWEAVSELLSQTFIHWNMHTFPAILTSETVALNCLFAPHPSNPWKWQQQRWCRDNTNTYTLVLGASHRRSLSALTPHRGQLSLHSFLSYCTTLCLYADFLRLCFAPSQVRFT